MAQISFFVIFQNTQWFLCGLSVLMCSELKNGPEAGGKSTQALTLCHLSFQSKSLYRWTPLLPCSLKQEADSCLENTLKPRIHTLDCTVGLLCCFHMGLSERSLKTTKSQIIDVSFLNMKVCCSTGIFSLTSAFCFPFKTMATALLLFHSKIISLTLLSFWIIVDEFQIFTPWIF